ncbi:MAG: SIS domain-containing protein [Deltaproteobacteria bacterium]|nr:SIS domain-containing protein [Deltaproteobacteria bacterium]
MQEVIASILRNSAANKAALASDQGFLESVERAAKELKAAAARGGTVYLCGNGGSACDAMHFCEELVARFKRERPGMRAVHFMDPGVLTCWGNDYDFESVFKRCVETFCGPDDVLVVFSTSGNSKNVLQAVEAAKSKQCFSLALTGRDGGKVATMADLSLIVPVQETERIQEVHITLVHIMCELMET